MDIRSDLPYSDGPPQPSEGQLQPLPHAERQIARLRTLQEISRKLNSKLELEDVLANILDEAIRTIGAERGCLFLVDAATGELEVRLSRRLHPSDLNSKPFRLSQTVIGRVWRDGNSVLTSNAAEDPELGKVDSVVKYTLRSILCVPLHLQEQPIGVLYLDNRLKAGQFQEDDLALAVAIADQASIAFHNAQLYQEVVDRATRQMKVLQYIQSLNQIRFKVQGLTNLTELFAVIGEELEQFGYGCAIVLLNSDGTHFEVQYLSSIGKRSSGIPDDMEGIPAVPVDETVVCQQVLKAHASQFVSDLGEVIAELVGDSIGLDCQPAFVAPLVANNRVIGLLILGLSDIHPEDSSLLVAFANQVATTIEMCRLHAEAQRRLEEQVALREAGAAISSTLDLDQILSKVTEKAAKIVGADSCTISRWDRDTGILVTLADYISPEVAIPDDVNDIGQPYLLADYPATARVLREHVPLIVYVDDPAADEAEKTLLRIYQWDGVLMVPMLDKGQAVGLMELYTDGRRRHKFSEDDVVLGQAMANQGAIAITNARLHAELRQRLREQVALREAGTAIASSLDQQTVLSHIAVQMGQAIDATSAYICGYDPETMTCPTLAEYISPQACVEERISDLGTVYVEDADTEFLELMQAGQHDISHIDDTNLSEFERAHMQQFGVKTILYIPLRVKGRLVGYAEVWESRGKREFTSEEIVLCQGIAQQAAIALENAQLYEQAQQELAERRQAESQRDATLSQREAALEALRESEERYRSLFEDSPISLWEEDFSDVKRHIDSLRASGVKDFPAYFGDHPEEVVNYAAMVKIVDINRATLELYQAGSIEEFRSSLHTVFTQESYNMFKEELLAIAEGKTVFESDTVTQTLKGDRNHIRLKWSVAPGYEDTLAKVLVSIIDITGRVRAEEKLYESEERARALLNAPIDSATLIDPEGTILALNEAAARRLGKGIDELVGTCVYDFFPPDLAESRKARIDEIVRSGKPIRFEDGREGRAFDTHIYPVFDAGGKVTAAAAYTRDITERKRAREALRESEERYRTLFEQANDAIHVANEKDEIVDVNRRACEMMDYSREELLTMRVPDLKAPEVRRQVGSVVKDELARYGNASFEALNVHRDGTRIPVEINVSRVTGSGGDLYISIVRDITERRRAEGALRQSEERLRSLFETMTEGVVLIAPDGQIAQANPAAEHILGLKHPEIEGRSYIAPDWEIFHPDGTPMPPEEMAGPRAMKEKRAVRNVVMGVKRPDGSTSWIDVSAAPLVDEASEIQGVVGTFADITERKQAGEEIRRRNRELELLNQTSQAFTSTLDLNQVFAAVLEGVRRLLSVTGVSIWLIDPQTDTQEGTGELVCRQVAGPGSEIVRGWRLAVGQGLAGWVASRGESLIVPDIQADERHFEDIDQKTGLDLHSSLCVPLRTKRGVIGVIQVVDTEIDRFDSTDLRWVEALASAAANAIENAQLYAQIRRLTIEQERHRLARQLHDTVTQSLYSIGIAAQASLRLLGQTDADSKALDPIEHILALSQTALTEMREQLYDLHPTVLSDKGLVEALMQHFGELRTRYLLSITFIADRELPLSMVQQEALYYIARGALWNIVRHANATHVEVSLAMENDQIILAAEDDGSGFDPTTLAIEETMGLRNIEERAKLIGGTLELQSRPGQGTKVTVRIPLRSSEEDETLSNA